MRFRSISFRIFIGMAGLTIFLLSIMWTINHFVYLEELRKYEVDYNVLVTNKIKSQFDFTTDLIRNSGNALGSKPEIMELLTLDAEMDPKELVKQKNKISTLLLSVKDIQPFFKGVHIVSKSGHVYSSVMSVDENYIKDFVADYFNLMNGENKPHELWTKLHEVIYSSDAIFNVMSYIRPVYNLMTQQLVGLIVMDIDYELVRQMFTISSIELNEKVMVVDLEGNIVFNHPFLSSYEPILKEYPQLLTSPNLQLRATVFGKDSIIVSQTIDMANWKIVRMIEAKPITKSSRDLLNFLNSIILVSAFVCLIYIFIVTQSITKPVRTLINACKRIEEGDRKFRVSLKLKNELGILGDTFNIMLDQLQSYYEKEFSDQQRKSEIEFQILQAQINPHFLYNTLDSIKWLAVMQNMNNIAEMSTSLINLLKYNLTHPSRLTTLKNEIENLKHYIQIQKFRYGDTFEFLTQLDTQTLDCRIIRFVLQPLVENCIIHGFEDMESGGYIRVISFIEDEKLHLVVIDNGSGMDLETVKDLNDNTSEKGKRFNTIGVRNIRERIQLQYGNEYGLYYASEPGVGTIAEIVLPVVYE